MNNQRSGNYNGKNAEDTYDVLHRNFSLFGAPEPLAPQEDDVRNSGEIYFSANDIPHDDSDYDFSRFSSSAGNDSYAYPAGSNPYGGYSKTNPAVRYPEPARQSEPPKQNKAENAKSAEQKKESADDQSVKKKKKRKKKKKKVNRKGALAKSLLLALVVLGFVLLAAMVVSEPVKQCMNDIIAIDRSSVQKMVVLEKDMTTDEVIEKLEDTGMIYSATFCKFASHLLHFDQSDPSKAIYPAGTYLLQYDMGIEGMLKEILSNGEVVSTVKIAFPEGYTIDQIVDRLVTNGVSTADALYEAMNSDELLEQYPFLQEIEDRSQRYRALEGYMYPDTYEFYLGENPQSVIKRFLDNFVAKWEDKYADMAESSGHSMDELIIVASVIQKEANDPVQMRTIASIIYNRLESGVFTHIDCDSTVKYIEAHQEELEAAGTYEHYLALYDSYQRQDLPVGPTCNPGEDAIIAALRPEDTDYYYFLHDRDGDIHVARTEDEHNANIATYLDN